MRADPRCVTVAAVCLLLATGVALADTRLEVSLDPRKIGVEDAARLLVKVYDPPRDLAPPDLPALDNLRVVAGPSTGQELRFVNGVTTSAVSFTWVLQPEGPGPARVGSVSLAAGDEELRSQPIEAEVVPGSVASQRRRMPLNPFDRSFDPLADMVRRRQVREPWVVLRHLMDRTSTALGDPLVATVVLDTTAGIEDLGWIDAPHYPGWWTQKVELPEEKVPEVVEVDDRRVWRFVIARHVIVPLQAGASTIPEVSARVAVRGQSFFEPRQTIERSTGTVAVEVVPRPTAPAGFAGAVGDLRYSAGIDPDRVSHDGSAEMWIRLTGAGNLPLVEDPTWPTCDGCELYPPEDEADVEVDASGIHGSRTWRATVVPRTSGELVLGAVPAAVYDPAAGRYRRQTLGPLTLQVEPPPPSPTPEASQVPEAAETTAGEVLERRRAAAVPWLWIAGALVVGVLLGAVAVWRGARRRGPTVPPPRPGQTPAERARELQVVLERWWLDVRDGARAEALRPEVDSLRAQLEAIRFAPGRSDHSETVVDVESAFRALLRRRR